MSGCEVLLVSQPENSSASRQQPEDSTASRNKPAAMASGELYCQICGVSFNIGRLRTVDEPQASAWDGLRRTLWGSSVKSTHYSKSNCKPGCMVTVRSNYPNADEFDAQTCEVFYPERPDPTPDDDMDPRFPQLGKDEYLEHIAGPDCAFAAAPEGAYSGHRISAQEMKGCNLLQCLMRKNGDPWSPDLADEDWEQHGELFLSGLTDGVPRLENTMTPLFTPYRHNYIQAIVNNNFPAEEINAHSIPFHPACLEVFKRASLFRYGTVKFEALEDWWIMEAVRSTFHDFPRHDAVKRGMGDWWNHIRGDEWLAANPCHIPDLDIFLCSTQRHNDTAPTESDLVQSKEPDDVFAGLPLELRVMIAGSISFSDILALRMASRSFWKLPQSVLHSTFLKERPWLWEAWSPADYSFWTSDGAFKILENGDLYLRFVAKVQQRRDMSDEELEEVHEDREVIRLEALSLLEASKSVPALHLDPESTDWFYLGRKAFAAMERGELKGLKNRRRIWNDCEEILNRAEQCQRERN